MIKKFQFEEEKCKIRSLWTQLNFIEGLIEFIEVLIAKKQLILELFWALIGRN